MVCSNKMVKITLTRSCASLSLSGPFSSLIGSLSCMVVWLHELHSLYSLHMSDLFIYLFTHFLILSWKFCMELSYFNYYLLVFFCFLLFIYLSTILIISNFMFSLLLFFRVEEENKVAEIFFLYGKGK